MWFSLRPSDLDWAARAPYRFDHEIVLVAPPARVFDVLADPSTWPAWAPDFVAAHWLVPPPPGVGAVREVKLRGMAARERFVAWQPGKRIAFSVDEVTLPLVQAMLEDFQLEPVGTDRTRLRWTVHYEPRRLARLIHPLLRVVFARMFRRVLTGLATYMNH